MILHVHSVIYNEIVILPYWLRHYEQYAERIYVWDGGSTDGTRELLETHPLVTVFDQGCRGLDDIAFTGYFMHYRELSRGRADWCACVAADEFIYHPELMSKLAHYSASGVMKIQLTGYTMVANQLPTTQGQIYDEIKHGHRDLWSTKTVLFNPEHEMHWLPGLHKELSDPKPARHTGIKLLHYRYLSSDYYLERTKRNYQRWQEAGIEVEFDPDRTHNLPDGSRGNPYQWYVDNVDKLEKVVE